MKRIVVVLCMIALAGGLFWYYPLIHVVRLDSPSAVEKQLTFDAANFSESFWDEQLMPALDDAANVNTVLAGSRQNVEAVRRQVRRKVGVSRASLFVLQGSGTIVSVRKDGVGVSLDQNIETPDVLLQTTPLFGNTVRDATGRLDAGDFANSQDFNDISTQLNRIVEDRVMATLKEQARIGRKIRFVGCAEISDAASIPRPLPLIPLKIEGE